MLNHSLPKFNFQLLVPAMPSEGMYSSIQVCCGTTELTALSFFVVFFLSHMFVKRLIWGLTTFLFTATSAALQQMKLANSSAGLLAPTSLHLGCPMDPRLA